MLLSFSIKNNFSSNYLTSCNNIYIIVLECVEGKSRFVETYREMAVGASHWSILFEDHPGAQWG